MKELDKQLKKVGETRPWIGLSANILCQQISMEIGLHM